MSSDPWRFQRWAYDTKTGNSARKAVLSMLAMMADMNTGRCEAKQETLAEGCELTDRSVRAHLRSLEEMGLVARRPQWRRDRGRRGDEFLLLAPGVIEWPDGERVHPEGFSGPPGTNCNPPRGIETSGQEQPPLLTNGHLSERGNTPSRTRVEVPNFALLDGKYQRILTELRRFADSKGASLDEPKALAACADFPGRDYVGAAEKMAEWFTSGPGGNTGRSSTNATWRKWLGNEAATAAAAPTVPSGHLTLAPVRHDRYSEKRQREIAREEAAQRVLAARQREDQ